MVKYRYIFSLEQVMSFINEEGRPQYKEDLGGIWGKWPCLHILLSSETFRGLPNNSHITNYCHWNFCLELGLSKHITAS